jgi:hypothetical protein
MTPETEKQGLPIVGGGRWEKSDVRTEREAEEMFGTAMTTILDPRLVELGQPS